MTKRFRLPLASVSLLGIVLPLAGCATLPASGPTAPEIVKRSNAPDAPLRFDIQALGATDVDQLNASATDASRPLALAEGNRVDLIGAGDILQVNLFEVGVSLFGRDTTNASGLFDPSAHAEKLPPMMVDDDGSVRVPFAGAVHVAGLTPDAAALSIEKKFAASSQRPQVVVTIANNVSNVAYVTGAVHKPGRLDLTLGHERLLDAIAEAGGSTNAPEDSVVRIVRGSQVAEERLSRIVANGEGDVPLSPGDRIEILNRPRSFLVFGASSKVSQVPFNTDDLSLAEAIARASGPNDTQADPTAVFLFRDQPRRPGATEVKPVIYRINMMEPSTYLLAQRFQMRDKDVIYIANARANQPSKLIGVVNQLFSPFVTARAVTR
jgi:polysaccharide export outer membrane protein